MLKRRRSSEKEFPRRVVLILLSVVFCLFHSICFAASNDEGESLSLIIANDVLSDYYKFMGGRSPHEIVDYSGEHSRRDVVEVVLLQQALKKGGCDERLVFTTADTYSRTIEEVKSGRDAITANTVWLQDIEQNSDFLNKSPVIIRQGEFEVGIYTSLRNEKLLSIKEVAELKNFTAVSNRNWKADWDTLLDLQISKLFNIKKWNSMVRMVDAGRVDFLLAPFQHTPGMMLKAANTTLVPLWGKKVQIKGSRYFAISKRHPKSHEVQQCVDAGMAELRKEGLIRKAYKDAGFIHQGVEGWQLLN